MFFVRNCTWTWSKNRIYASILNSIAIIQFSLYDYIVVQQERVGGACENSDTSGMSRIVTVESQTLCDLRQLVLWLIWFESVLLVVWVVSYVLSYIDTSSNPECQCVKAEWKSDKWISGSLDEVGNVKDKASICKVLHVCFSNRYIVGKWRR